jgi:hypothetical protein
MENLLLEMSRQHAPTMGENYHKETVRIAEHILRRCCFKWKARPQNEPNKNKFKE